MLIAKLNRLPLIPAEVILRNPTRFPDGPGAYLFFFNGGTKLLAATAYFDGERRRPFTIRRRQHLYTGAARDIRFRLRQHMETDLTSSSLRLTLLAIERQHRAISRSGTPNCAVKGEKSLTAWLAKNAFVATILDEEPFDLERLLLQRYASPFNIVMRRQHPYARALSACRQSEFPSGHPDAARRLRRS